MQTTAAALRATALPEASDTCSPGCKRASSCYLHALYRRPCPRETCRSAGYPVFSTPRDVHSDKELAIPHLPVEAAPPLAALQFRCPIGLPRGGHLMSPSLGSPLGGGGGGQPDSARCCMNGTLCVMQVEKFEENRRSWGKKCQPVALSGKIPTHKILGVTPSGIKTITPCWKATALATTSTVTPTDGGFPTEETNLLLQQNSTLHVLEHLLEQQQALTLVDSTIKLPVKLTASQWEQIKNVTSILKIFDHVILAARAAVAEQLARSPPTKANWVKSPAGSPDFHKWELCRTMQLVGISHFSNPVVPYSLQSPSSALKTLLLRAAQISSLNSLLQNLEMHGRAMFHWLHQLHQAVSGGTLQSGEWWLANSEPSDEEEN
ncbi:hypothetical protein PR048_032580 [Dryococelus australis]|uniref:Uncharacterized protein n=1 Tax=Dryococelus australis TaxID=614101 RepID=A0ABQ9G2M2_9NEOP|nr:hypothetical protein PR048_032580 [Dryococelus australis]